MTDMVRATTYLDADLYVELKEAADRRDVTVSQLLRRMVRQTIAEERIRARRIIDDDRAMITDSGLLIV